MNRDALIAQVRGLLQTIAEAIEHLRNTEDAELGQTVALGRQSVAGILEQEFGVSPESRFHASALADEDWLRAISLMLDSIEEPFVPENAFDFEFLRILEHIWSRTEEELLDEMKAVLRRLRKLSGETYDRFVEYFARFPLWGSFRPDRGDWTTLQLRAAVLKRHSYDFLWLYLRLDDYLSKRTLTAILLNWLSLDVDYPTRIKSIFPDYWEPDLFPNNTGDVLVDVGAYTGDSIAQYIQMYGSGYRKIYAYEISEDSCAKLRHSIAAQNWHDVEVRRRGAGAEHGELFLSASESDASANRLSADGAGARVPIVPLDDDIEEPVTFIKMDIEGAEHSALLGCEQTIRTHRPKLAICVYHGYDDLWRIPELIDAMNPDYRFYLRHNGGNLIPTEFVLLCKPE